MHMWILTDETGRIRAASEDTQIVGAEWLEAPEGAAMEDIGSYRWEGWGWVHDPLPVQEPEAEPDVWEIINLLTGGADSEG